MEMKTTFDTMPVGEYFNLKPNQQYGWNAWTKCFPNGGTNARKFNDFRDFPADTVVYVNVGSRRSKAAKRYKALGAKEATN